MQELFLVGDDISVSVVPTNLVTLSFLNHRGVSFKTQDNTSQHNTDVFVFVHFVISGCYQQKGTEDHGLRFDSSDQTYT